MVWTSSYMIWHFLGLGFVVYLAGKRLIGTEDLGRG
jgi:hypothetical protein